MIDISNLSKAVVLCKLYNASKPQGLGFLHFTASDLTLDEAEELLSQPGKPHFDYLNGRVLKIDLSTNELDTRLYDRDNGEGAARKALGL